MFRMSFKTAIHWLHKSLIWCDEITNIDPMVYDNLNYNFDEETEIFQWFLTDFNEDEINWMRRKFPSLIFSYSNKLELYVLCVDHCGTGWDYVGIDCTDDDMILYVSQEEFSRFNNKGL